MQHQGLHGPAGRAFGHRVDRSRHERLEVVHGAAQAQVGRRAGAVVGGILAGRLAQLVGLHQHVADVVGHLVGLAQAFAQGAPAGGVGTGSQGAGAGGGHEQRAGLGPLVGRQFHLGFAFPGLAGHDAVRGTGAAAHQLQQAGQAVDVFGRLPCAMGQGLVCQHDEGIAGEQGQRFAIQTVHRGLAAPGVGVVEGGHVVVHQRGAVQQLDGHGRRVAQGRGAVAAGPRHRQAELGPDACATGKHRVPHGRQQPGRGAGAVGPQQLRFERLLYA